MNAKARQPTYGFRLSVLDVAATAAVALVSWVAIWTIGPFAILLPFVFGHFLLFCNVVRIGTDFEVLWACWLVLVVAVALLLDCFSWWLVLALQTPVTVGLVFLAVRSAGYHGLFCRQLNPNLDAYLNDPQKYQGFVMSTAQRMFRPRNKGPGVSGSEQKSS